MSETEGPAPPAASSDPQGAPANAYVHRDEVPGVGPGAGGKAQRPDAGPTDAERRRERNDSLRCALHKAWWDVHHSRDQTWKALQIVVAMAAGMIAIDWQVSALPATVAAGILVVFSAIFGVAVAVRHRNFTEKNQYAVIRECESQLGIRDLHDYPTDSASISPAVDIFRFNTAHQNVSVFIVRMNVVLAAFAIVWVVARVGVGYPEPAAAPTPSPVPAGAAAAPVSPTPPPPEGNPETQR